MTTPLNQQIYDRQAQLLDLYNGGAAGRAQATFAGLVGNLRGVVRSLLNYTITVDAAATSHTNEDGGTSATLVAALNSIPASASAVVFLKPGSTHTLTEDIVTKAVGVGIIGEEGGARPIINWPMVVNSGFNELRIIRNFFAGQIRLDNIEVRLPTALANPGLPVTTTRRSMFSSLNALPLDVGTTNCLISGGIAGTRLGFGDAGSGTSVSAGFHNSTLSGQIAAVVNNVSGLAMIAKSGLTLSNGAILSEGGIVGTTYLTN